VSERKIKKNNRFPQNKTYLFPLCILQNDYWQIITQNRMSNAHQFQIPCKILVVKMYCTRSTLVDNPNDRVPPLPWINSVHICRCHYSGIVFRKNIIHQIVVPTDVDFDDFSRHFSNLPIGYSTLGTRGHNPKGSARSWDAISLNFASSSHSSTSDWIASMPARFLSACRRRIMLGVICK